MKKTCLAVFMFYAPSVLFAQPVLHAPVLSSVIGSQADKVTCAYVPAGAGGANASWNFTALQPGTTYTTTYLTPASGSQAASFPTSNLLAQSAGIGLEYYYSLDNNTLRNNGDVENGGHLFILSDTRDIMHYPFAFGNSFTDSYYGTHTYTSFSGTIGGKDSVTADGWGTLALPGATWPDVLRVKTVRDYSDTLSSQPVVSYHAEIYDYYTDGNISPIFSITYYKVFVNGSLYTSIQNAVYSETASTGVGETGTASCKVFPNPASGKFSVSLSDSKATAYTLTNMHGQVVCRKALAPGTTRFEADGNGLAAGIYVLTVLSGSEPLIRRTISLR